MKKPHPVLRVDEILLRRWTSEDAEWYVESRDEEVFRWTTEKRDLRTGDAAEAIRQANRTDGAFCFAVVNNDTGQLLGNIAVVLEAGNQRSGEIMFWLAPWGRGHGVAVRAVRVLCHWAYSELDLERITAKTLPDNHRSQRVVMNAGFQTYLPENNRKHDDGYTWFAITKQAFRRNSRSEM